MSKSKIQAAIKKQRKEGKLKVEKLIPLDATLIIGDDTIPIRLHKYGSKKWLRVRQVGAELTGLPKTKNMADQDLGIYAMSIALITDEKDEEVFTCKDLDYLIKNKSHLQSIVEVIMPDTGSAILVEVKKST